MFYNNTACDIYIGTGAGKKLLHDIEHAKRSVKIVSPYLSPFLIRKLIGLHERNIDVQLITMDTIEDFYGDYEKNIRQLIIQDRTIDEEAKRIRLKWIGRKRFLKIFMGTAVLCLCILSVWLQDFIFWIGAAPIILAWILSRYATNKVKNTQIYRYTYRRLFPFKVIVSPHSNASYQNFIHGKMYIIDDETAYLGSLNFTGNGTRNNYETRIRITDTGALKELANEFNGLFQNTDLRERDIDSWGKELYLEPIAEIPKTLRFLNLTLFEF